MTISRKPLLITAAVIIIAIALLHAYVNINGKALVIAKLKEVFGREVSVGSVKARLPLNVVIKNIEVKDLLKIEKAYAVGGALDLFRKDFTLHELRLDRITVDLQKEPAPEVKQPAQPTESATPAPEAGASAPEAGAPEPKAGDPTPEAGASVPGSGAPASEGETPLPGPAAAENAVSPPAEEPVPEKRYFGVSGFRLKHLVINDGTLNYTDRSMPGKEVHVKVNKVYASIENLEVPIRKSNIITVDFKGMMPWQDQAEEGSVEFSGWVNLFKKDMQAKIQVTGIDGVALQPYYSGWIDLEKARIEKARLNFTSDIHGLNNELTAQCRLELTDIVRKPREADEPQERAERIASVVLDIFRSLNQGKIVLDFTLHTNMDRPEFGFENIRMAVEEKIAERRKATSASMPQQAAQFPLKILEGTVRGVTDFSRALVDGTFAVGNELKKAVEEAFRKEQ